jgi:hypothetical protein
MKEYLFIGGSADGKHLETDGWEYHRVMVPRPFPEIYTSSGFDVRPEDVTVETETYILQRFSILGRRVEAYVLDGVSPREVADLLISKYRNP